MLKFFRFLSLMVLMALLVTGCSFTTTYETTPKEEKKADETVATQEMAKVTGKQSLDYVEAIKEVDDEYALFTGVFVKASDLEKQISATEALNGVVESQQNPDVLLFSTVDSADGAYNFYTYDVFAKKATSVKKGLKNNPPVMIAGALDNVVVLAPEGIDYIDWSPHPCFRGTWFTGMEVSLFSFDYDNPENGIQPYKIPQRITDRYKKLTDLCQEDLDEYLENKGMINRSDYNDI